MLFSAIKRNCLPVFAVVQGAEELARKVVEACEEDNKVEFLYPLDMKFRDRVEKIVKEVYGGDGVDWSKKALEKAIAFENDPKYDDFATMMVKTQYSLSDNPDLKGEPKGWRLQVSDVLEYDGARFLCPVAGGITMMPGTGSKPAYMKVDIDVNTGKISGIF